MVGLDSLGRAAIRATSLVPLKKRGPFREREVSTSRRDAPFVTGDANIRAGSFQIPFAPPLVVVEPCSRIRRVLLPVPLALACAKFLDVLRVIAPAAVAPALAVALV